MKKIENIIGIDNIKYNEPMSKHTSFKIGGLAEVFATVDSLKKLEQLLKYCKENNIKTTIIGNGSNILVSDKGIKGIVIKYTESKIEINKKACKAVCSAGVLNPILAQKLLENNLSGFEFAAGIPGTIAGAVYMNAGAFSGEMKNIVDYVKYINLDTSEIKVINNKDIKFSYRKSIFQKMNMVIIEVGLILKEDTRENIEEKMTRYRNVRIHNQPLEYGNAGSTFKRGEDFISAKLIDDAGLKGYTIGGAQVSTKHSGFIINLGNATAKDVLELIEYVKKVVYEKYGKKLETEIKYLE